MRDMIANETQEGIDYMRNESHLVDDLVAPLCCNCRKSPHPLHCSHALHSPEPLTLHRGSHVDPKVSHKHHTKRLHRPKC